MKPWFGRYRTIIKKTVTSLVAVCFLANFVLHDAWGLVYMREAPYEWTPDELSQFSSLNIDTFSVPAHLGEIKETYSAGSDKFIIHLQDAHCNQYAQHKISDLIDYFNSEYGLRVINLEGGAGDYDLAVFTSISGKEIRKEVADYFMKKGEINGAEFYAINNPDKIILWGIEDKPLYLANLKVYRDSLIYKSEVDEFLGELTYALDNLKRHIYSPKLLKIDEAYHSYKSGEMDFRKYLEFLIETANEEGISIKDFHNLDLLSETMRMESAIDFDKANMERNALVDELKSGLSKNEIKELVARSVSFKTKMISRKAFYDYLLKKAREVGLDVGRFPALSNYAAYVSTYDEVDRSRVMEEMDNLETGIKNKLYQTGTQRELNELSKKLALLNNIFAISLTKRDYQYYLANKDSFNVDNFLAFIKKEAPKYKVSFKPSPNITKLDDYRAQISEFYDYSFKRDDAFIQNMRLGQLKGNIKGAVIMTGGFHTENLCELFKANGISYVSILPKFTNEKDYKSPYFELLAGQTANIQGMLGSVLAKAAMMQVASMLNKALGEAVWGKNTLAGFEATVSLMAREGVEFIKNIKDITFDEKTDVVVFHMKDNSKVEKPLDYVWKGVVVAEKLNEEDIIAKLFERSWYYRKFTEEERAVFQKQLFNGLKPGTIDRIRKLALEALKEETGVDLEQSAIVSVVLFGSWCYNLDSRPTDIDIAVIVDGIDENLPIINMPIRNSDEWFVDGARAVDNCDFKILSRKLIEQESGPKNEGQLQEEAKLWGHGIIIDGPDPVKGIPSVESLIGVIRGQFLMESYIRSQDLKNRDLAAKTKNLSKISRRWQEVVNILDMLLKDNPRAVSFLSEIRQYDQNIKTAISQKNIETAGALIDQFTKYLGREEENLLKIAELPAAPRRAPPTAAGPETGLSWGTIVPMVIGLFALPVLAYFNPAFFSLAMAVFIPRLGPLDAGIHRIDEETLEVYRRAFQAKISSDEESAVPRSLARRIMGAFAGLAGPRAAKAGKRPEAPPARPVLSEYQLEMQRRAKKARIGETLVPGFALTGNIAAGLDNEKRDSNGKTEEDRWRDEIEAQSEAVKIANRDIVNIVKKRCDELLGKEKVIRAVLKRHNIPDDQIEDVIDALRDPANSFMWFNARVEGREKYLLGHEKALAINVLQYLVQQERAGEVKNLSYEYILHEALERTNLGHSEIIALTSKLFNRPAYTRHGETPLGQALRGFIDAQAEVIAPPVAKPPVARAKKITPEISTEARKEWERLYAGRNDWATPSDITKAHFQYGIVARTEKPKLYEKIDEITLRIWEGTGRREKAPHIFLLQSSRPDTYLSPENNMFITLGLFKLFMEARDGRITDEDIAFVIAHEIGHYLQKRAGISFKKPSGEELSEAERLNIEHDADNHALQLMDGGGYNATSALDYFKFLTDYEQRINRETEEEIKGHREKIELMERLLDEENMEKALDTDGFGPIIHDRLFQSLLFEALVKAESRERLHVSELEPLYIMMWERLSPETFKGILLKLRNNKADLRSVFNFFKRHVIEEAPRQRRFGRIPVMESHPLDDRRMSEIAKYKATHYLMNTNEAEQLNDFSPDLINEINASTPAEEDMRCISDGKNIDKIKERISDPLKGPLDIVLFLAGFGPNILRENEELYKYAIEEAKRRGLGKKERNQFTFQVNILFGKFDANEKLFEKLNVEELIDALAILPSALVELQQRLLNDEYYDIDRGMAADFVGGYNANVTEIIAKRLESAGPEEKIKSLELLIDRYNAAETSDYGVDSHSYSVAISEYIDILASADISEEFIIKILKLTETVWGGIEVHVSINNFIYEQLRRNPAFTKIVIKSGVKLWKLGWGEKFSAKEKLEEGIKNIEFKALGEPINNVKDLKTVASNLYFLVVEASAYPQWSHFNYKWVEALHEKAASRGIDAFDFLEGITEVLVDKKVKKGDYPFNIKNILLESQDPLIDSKIDNYLKRTVFSGDEEALANLSKPVKQLLVLLAMGVVIEMDTLIKYLDELSPNEVAAFYENLSKRFTRDYLKAKNMEEIGLPYFGDIKVEGFDIEVKEEDVAVTCPKTFHEYLMQIYIYTVNRRQHGDRWRGYLHRETGGKYFWGEMPPSKTREMFSATDTDVGGIINVLNPTLREPVMRREMISGEMTLDVFKTYEDNLWPLLDAEKSWEGKIKIVAREIPASVFRNYFLHYLFFTKVLNPDKEPAMGLEDKDFLNFELFKQKISTISDENRRYVISAFREMIPYLVRDRFIETLNRNNMEVYMFKQVRSREGIGSLSENEESFYQANSGKFEDMRYRETGTRENQLDLMLAEMVRGSLEKNIIQKWESVSKILDAIETIYPRASNTRDWYLNLLFTRIREGKVEMPDLKVLERLSGMMFSGDRANHVKLIALQKKVDEHIKKNGSITFEEELDMIVGKDGYFTEMDEFRDDILRNLEWNSVSTKDELRKLREYLTFDFETRTSRERVKRVKVQDKIFNWLRMLKQEEKEELLLWLSGLTEEKPESVKKMEIYTFSNLDALREGAAVSTARYQDIGLGARREFLKQIIMGDEESIIRMNPEDNQMLQGASKFADRFWERMSKRYGISDDEGAPIRTILKIVLNNFDDNPARQFNILTDIILTFDQITKDAEFKGYSSDKKLGALARVFLESVGLIGIKIGQYLAISSNFDLPQEFREELLELTEREKGMDKGMLFSVLGKLGFGDKAIEKVMKAASIKTVLKLKDEDFVTKVKNLGVYYEAKTDLDRMGRVLQELFNEEMITEKQEKDLMEEMNSIVRTEIDFKTELRNIERMHKLKEKRPGKPHWLYSLIDTFAGIQPDKYTVAYTDTEGMEVISDMLINETEVIGLSLKSVMRGEAGDFSPEEINGIKMMVAFETIRQIFDDGVFHADLHPGNIMVNRELDGKIHITILDWGLVLPVGVPNIITESEMYKLGLDSEVIERSFKREGDKYILKPVRDINESDIDDLLDFFKNRGGSDRQKTVERLFVLKVANILEPLLADMGIKDLSTGLAFLESMGITMHGNAKAVVNEIVDRTGKGESVSDIIQTEIEKLDLSLQRSLDKIGYLFGEETPGAVARKAQPIARAAEKAAPEGEHKLEINKGQLKRFLTILRYVKIIAEVVEAGMKESPEKYKAIGRQLLKTFSVPDSIGELGSIDLKKLCDRAELALRPLEGAVRKMGPAGVKLTVTEKEYEIFDFLVSKGAAITETMESLSGGGGIDKILSGGLVGIGARLATTLQRTQSISELKVLAEPEKRGALLSLLGKLHRGIIGEKEPKFSLAELEPAKAQIAQVFKDEIITQYVFSAIDRILENPKVTNENVKEVLAQLVQIASTVRGITNDELFSELSRILDRPSITEHNMVEALTQLVQIAQAAEESKYAGQAFRAIGMIIMHRAEPDNPVTENNVVSVLSQFVRLAKAAGREDIFNAIYSASGVIGNPEVNEKNVIQELSQLIVEKGAADVTAKLPGTTITQIKGIDQLKAMYEANKGTIRKFDLTSPIIEEANKVLDNMKQKGRVANVEIVTTNLEDELEALSYIREDGTLIMILNSNGGRSEDYFKDEEAMAHLTCHEFLEASGMSHREVKGLEFMANEKNALTVLNRMALKHMTVKQLEAIKEDHQYDPQGQFYRAVQAELIFRTGKIPAEVPMPVPAADIPKMIDSLMKFGTKERETAQTVLLGMLKNNPAAIRDIVKAYSSERGTGRDLQAIQDSYYDFGIFIQIVVKADELKIEIQQIFDELINALKDHDINVSDYAFRALGIIAAARSDIAPGLATALGNGDVEVRVYTALAFVEAAARNPKAISGFISQLNSALADENASVRESVARSLAILEGRLELKDDIVPVLIKGLTSENENRRKGASLALSEVAKASPLDNPLEVAALTNALRDKNAEVKANAALALAGSVNENNPDNFIRAIPGLRNAMVDKDEKVGGYAAMAVGRIAKERPTAVIGASPGIGELLGKALVESKGDARLRVAGGLKSMSRTQSGSDELGNIIAELKKGLSDRDVRVKEYVAAIFRNVSDRKPGTMAEAVPELTKALSDEGGLEPIGGEPVIKIDAAMVLENLTRVNPEAARPAIPALKKVMKDKTDKNRRARRHAVAALGNIAARIEGTADGIIPVLVEALTDKSESVKEFAARALVYVAARRPEVRIPELVELLKHKNNDIKKGAVRALAELVLLDKLSPGELIEEIKNPKNVSIKRQLFRILDLSLESVVAKESAETILGEIMSMEGVPVDVLKYARYYKNLLEKKPLTDGLNLRYLSAFREHLGYAERGKGKKLLVVHNIKDGRGDEHIRMAPLLQAIMDEYPELDITIYTDRPSFYEEWGRVHVKSLVDFELETDHSFDMIIDHYDKDQNYEKYYRTFADMPVEIEIESLITNARKPPILIRTDKQNDNFEFRSVEIEGVEVALEIPAGASVYTPVSRLVAELGLPLRFGTQKPAGQSLLLGGIDENGRFLSSSKRSEAADRWWEENVYKKRAGRRVVFYTGFGGENELKGLPFDRMVRDVNKLVKAGCFVIIFPNDTEWGNRARAGEILSKAAEGLSEGEKGYVIVSPGPAGTQDVPDADGLIKYWINKADRVVMVEGGMHHMDYNLGGAYISQTTLNSGPPKWIPPMRAPDQTVLDITATTEDVIRSVTAGEAPAVVETEAPVLAAGKAHIEAISSASKNVLSRARPGEYPSVVLIPLTEDRALYEGTGYAKLGRDSERTIVRKYGANIQVVYYDAQNMEKAVEEIKKMDNLKDERARIIAFANENEQALVKGALAEFEGKLAGVVGGTFAPAKDTERFSTVTLTIVGLGLIEWQRSSSDPSRQIELSGYVQGLIAQLVENPSAVKDMNSQDLMKALLAGKFLMHIEPINYNELKDFMEQEAAVLESL